MTLPAARAVPEEPGAGVSESPPGREDVPSAGVADDMLDDFEAFAQRPSDWGSLVADLSRGREAPIFQIHDRTHVEFAVDYRLEPNTENEFVWEAYFFAPESLRLDSRTYDKSDLYADLQSYVRFEVPASPLVELGQAPLERLRKSIEQCEPVTAVREMRLYACMVRAAGVEARDAVVSSFTSEKTHRDQAFSRAARFIKDVSAIGPRLRSVLAPAQDLPDPVATAARWIDEDISRLAETLLGSLARKLAVAEAPASLCAAAERAAVREARYRVESGLGGVGTIGMPSRTVEELEFRRHVLKRFTSSVLWLSPEIRPGSTWVLHLLYAIAASVAMMFAIMAAMWNGSDWTSRGFVSWAVAVIIGYAAKDRIKALLQSLFTNVVSRHFPDRRWTVRDRERSVVLGEMEEQSGFIGWGDLPSEVLEMRRRTRLHSLEEQARPETVLFHRKEVRLREGRIAQADARFTALTEIFRLDLRRWLAHTDDPKREIVFADPHQGVIGSAVAPRVYNIGIVYRLRKGKDENAPWHRVRIVVTRKGIRRIDSVA